MKALFREVSYRLSKLLAEIEDGEIGLPEIQRLFVWSRAKVRDLFDSMYRGFPVGYLLFWENPSMPSTRQIGTDEKQHVPRRLIVDGQQRLTSLYSVILGRPIVDDQYRETISRFRSVHEMAASRSLMPPSSGILNSFGTSQSCGPGTSRDIDFKQVSLSASTPAGTCRTTRRTRSLRLSTASTTFANTPSRLWSLRLGPVRTRSLISSSGSTLKAWS